MVFDSPTEENIVLDCLLSFDGIYEMEPDYSMIKFRNLFEPVKDFSQNQEMLEKIGKIMNVDIKKHLSEGNIPFYKGVIYNQAWRGRYSTESRLYVDKYAVLNNDIVVYNGKQFESINYFYNAILRTSMYFKNPLVKVACMDNCGDCSIEGTIWNDYNKKYGQNAKKYIDKFNNLVKQNLCNKKFDTNKHGILLF
jgi:hypothetical protein